MLTYQISATDHGRRAVSFLQNLIPGAPLSYLHKVLKGKNFTINGTPPSACTILRISDNVAIKETERMKTFMNFPSSTPDILLEDDRIMIFNKPSGIAVHRTAEHGNRNLMNWAKEFIEMRDGKTCRLYPVNRLDKGTSGAIIAAKSSEFAGDFGKLFQEGLIYKSYLALVSGKMQDEGIIDAPLDGKEAVTTFRTIFHGGGASLLLVNTHTGRTHQIRRHLADVGHPLLGDKRYGGKNLQGFNNDALHAWGLDFPYRFSGQYTSLYAPVTSMFLKNLENIAGCAVCNIFDSLIKYR
jgi:23S rRNA pseudouridine955/2504/2580 synthase